MEEEEGEEKRDERHAPMIGQANETREEGTKAYFVFKQKRAYGIWYGLVGSEMCIGGRAMVWARMEPRSKSEWITPAAWGALVPAGIVQALSPIHT